MDQILKKVFQFNISRKVQYMKLNLRVKYKVKSIENWTSLTSKFTDDADVTNIGEERLNRNWQYAMKIADVYVDFKYELINVVQATRLD